MTEKTSIELVRKFGFEAGPRDPKVNPEYAGAYMVTDGDGWAIVGDDLDELVHETVELFELTWPE